MKKADLTDLVDDNIRNKTPKVVKTEHADVEQALVNEFFPTPVTVQWNGTSSVSPTTDIIVFPTLVTGKVKFTIRFWKSGNDVYFNCDSFEAYDYLGDAVSNLQLIEWNTSLFQPLATSRLIVTLECNNSIIPLATPPFKIKVDNTGMYLFGDMLPSIAKYGFNGTYKVAN